jgi:hypothetical protein
LLLIQDRGLTFKNQITKSIKPREREDKIFTFDLYRTVVQLFMFKHFLLFLSLISFSAFAQDHFQVIRGKVLDKESKSPLPGATVILASDTITLRGVITDAKGSFRIENVPVGKHAIKISYIGYKPLYMDGIIVTSGKEVILDISIEESVTSMKEVEISATRKHETVNEMAVISARAFSVEETDRYAGSRGDPARMASNFAGVQGSNDTRNDIVVRGNSPMGVLWRLEGIDIPNPNHFAVAGSTGGPVSILNNKVLANSDFLTGAFPAEYGNSTAGVFDVRMRNGNNEKAEFTGQFGFLGTELTAEGPFSKKSGSSYLINYRYSTLKLFESMKIPIGTGAIPSYQDAAFKFNFPVKKGVFSLFGVGGKSNIEIWESKKKREDVDIYGESDRDQFFGSTTAVTGASYVHFINPTSYARVTAAASYYESHSIHNQVVRDSLWKVIATPQILGYKGEDIKYTTSFYINKKMGSRNVIKSGMFLHRFQFNIADSILEGDAFHNRIDAHLGAYLFQPYIQWKYKITDDLEWIAGVHAMHYTLNNNSVVEPRAAIKWNINPRQSIGIGTGVHSQLQPSYIPLHHIYFNGQAIRHNKNIGFSRSNHYVLSYDHSIGNNTRLRAETYYQQLYNIPVEVRTSAYSIINQGVGFQRFFPDSLQNTGTGTNKGVELTVEKFFSKSFFFLATASIFDSKYRGSDGIERNTDFNGRFATNFLIGKDFKTSNNSVLSLSSKSTWAGGRRYTPVDLEASVLANEAVFIDELTNTLQLRDYFRQDLRISYRINSKKITHEIALDLINLLGIKNVLTLSYSPNPENPTANPMVEQYQLGFLPLFYYKIDF